MKTHTIEWKHLDQNGRTCDRCHDTGANLRSVVRKLNTSLRSRRVRFRLKETRLKPSRLAESNSIIIDGRPLETLLPATRVTTTECGSCGELLGQPTDCRALTQNGQTYDTIPAELIHDALRKVAEAESPEQNGSAGRRKSLPATRAYHVPAGEGPSFWGPGDRYTFLATGDQTAGAYFLMEAIVPPGGGPPPHIHRREAESYYILEGTLDVTLGDRRFQAGPGDFVHTPIGTAHAFHNSGRTTARMLVFCAPTGLEKFFEVTLERANDRRTPTTKNMEAVVARYLEAAPRFGIEFV